MQTERGETPTSPVFLHVALFAYREAVTDYMTNAVRKVDVGFGAVSDVHAFRGAVMRTFL